MSLQLKVQMHLARETKNTFRYEAASLPGAPDPLVSTFYIRKSAFPDGAPRIIHLLITIPSEADLLPSKEGAAA